MPKPLPTPTECANCGASIPRAAKACPDCGADERTGWRAQSVYDHIGLTDDVWTVEGSPENSPSRSEQVNGVAWYWWCVAAALLALIVGSVMGVK